MLKIRDLYTAYGPIMALRGVSLEVPEGDIVTLLGANGAGKSTTLRTISGLVHPVKGGIDFMGRSIEKHSPEEVVEIGISQVPEGRQIFFELTVMENLQLGSYVRRDRRSIREDLERVFQYFPILTERRKQVAGTLSGGEQQMLAIGRALMTEPRLLCLDEPSMGLSPILVQQVFDIIQKINKDLGTTIFMVEQNASMALNIAHRGYVLQTGRIVAADEACNLAGDDAIKAAYLGG